MLNPFPELLIYQFYAPTLLRLAAAAVFFYLAAHTIKNQDRIATTRLPIVGATGSWIAWVGALIELTMGVLFLAGFYTQIAALLGGIAVLKYFALRRFWPHSFSLFFPLAPAAMFLLGILCVSLLLTGAGAFAFDVRL